VRFFNEIIEEIGALSPQKQDLRNLGLVFLVALGLIGGFMIWRGRPWGPYILGLGLLFGLWGLIWPTGLKWVHRGWLSLAIVMGAVVSRLVLVVLFYVTVTPIGLIMRLLGKDLLDLKMDGRASYWKLRPDEEYDPVRTEKMY